MKTSNIASDRTALAAHLRSVLAADRDEAQLALAVAAAVLNYISQGKRCDKRVAAYVEQTLHTCGYTKAQAWWQAYDAFPSGKRFEVHYRVGDRYEYSTCRVFPRTDANFAEWQESFCDGPTQLAERICRIDACLASGEPDDLADRIITVRESQQALRDAVGYDERHSKRHPLAYEISEACEFRD
jgi:hypothetical protein